MKKFLAIVLTLALTASLLGACGGGSSSAPAPASASAAGSGSAAQPEGEVPSVVLVTGNASDKSFSESAANGLKQLTEQYGAKTKVIEYGNDDTKILPTLEDVSGGEWDIIVAIGFQSADPMMEVAAKFPDQKYILLDTQVDHENGANPNIYSADYKGNEGAFLAGALASLVSTSSEMPQADPSTKMVGFVGGMDITLINDFVLGFIQGAQYIDPEMKVITSYTASWTDAAKGKEIAKTMFDAGCDVVYNGAGGAGLGALDAGKEAGKYSIGTDSDQSLLYEDDPEKANLILTSQLKSLDKNIVQVVERYMNGEEVFGKGETLGVAEGIICLSNNDYYQKNVPQDIRDQITELEGKILSGEIAVDTAYGMDEAQVKEIINGARP